MTPLRATTLPTDFRFTTKGDTLYAIEMGWPSERRGGDQDAAHGHRQESHSVDIAAWVRRMHLAFEQKDDGLHIKAARRESREVCLCL